MSNEDDTMPPDTLIVEYDPTDGPVESILDAVADYHGTAVVELTPLTTAVDPDAVAALFDPEEPHPLQEGALTLTYEELSIRITTAGHIRLQPADGA
ncbi:HalOD1 output domain-containing protein [Halobacteriales archaeon Cl-PHB]